MKIALRCRLKRGSKSKWQKKKPCSDHFLEVQMSKKCRPFWREEHLEVKMRKTYHARSTFGSSNVEKVHGVLARARLAVKMFSPLRVQSTFVN